MSGIDDRMTRASILRTAVIALIPALIVFILEETTKPAKPYIPPAGTVEFTHTLSKQDWSQISGFAMASNTMLAALNRVAPTGNPVETSCVANLKAGTVAYIAPMLSRLQQEMLLSMSMKHEADEAMINQNVASISKTFLNSVPIMDKTLKGLMLSCRDTKIALGFVQQTQIFLDRDLAPYLRNIEQRITPNQPQGGR